MADKQELDLIGLFEDTEAREKWLRFLYENDPILSYSYDYADVKGISHEAALEVAFIARFVEDNHDGIKIKT